jgi:hypothetical protein
VRPAPAQVALKRLAYLVLVGRRIAAQQGHGTDDHAGGAVSALGRLFLDERLLDGVQRPAGREPLDRGDVRALGGPGGEVAGRPGLAGHEDEARAAQADAAAEPRPGKPQVVAEHVEQGRIRLAADPPGRPVHGHVEFRLHMVGIPSARTVDEPTLNRVCIRLQA